MKAIIFDNLAEFNKLHDRVHKAMLADGAKQERWCFPDKHPKGNRIWFTVEDRMLEYLTDKERARIVELLPDWFPPIPSEGLEL